MQQMSTYSVALYKLIEHITSKTTFVNICALDDIVAHYASQCAVKSTIDIVDISTKQLFGLW